MVVWCRLLAHAYAHLHMPRRFTWLGLPQAHILGAPHMLEEETHSQPAFGIVTAAAEGTVCLGC